MRRLIREQEPSRPSIALSTQTIEIATTVAQRRGSARPQLMQEVRGDLDWIVMKALDKDRKRRYDSANSLAQDLQHYLRGEPVSARRPTTSYVLGKLVRRHRIAFAAGAAISVALLLGVTASTILYLRERVSRIFGRASHAAGGAGGQCRRRGARRGGSGAPRRG